MVSQTETGFKRFVKALPLILLAIFMVALPLGGLILIIYSAVLTAAFKTAMIFTIIFGGGLLATGAGIGAADGFIQYKNHFYPNIETPTVAKTQIPKEKKKKLGNAAMGILLIGSVCIVVSAGLGCLDREKWIEQRTPYMTQNGYFAEVQKREVSFPISTYNLKRIEINLDRKNAVVIYDSKLNGENVTVSGYFSYENQTVWSIGDGVLKFTETPSPRLNRPLDNMLFFLFNENKLERQIKIYIPLAYKNDLEIGGKFVVAKN